MPARRTKYSSPVPRRRARIEIIPLIDVMFFLLASFMMVSLSMQKAGTVSLNLPKTQSGEQDVRPDLLTVGVDAQGKTFLGKEAMGIEAMIGVISNRFRVNTNLAVFVSGDVTTAHGAVVRVLNGVRSAGVQKVAFTVSPAPSAAGASGPPAGR